MQRLAHRSSTPSAPESSPPCESSQLHHSIERLLAGQEDLWTTLMATIHPLAMRLCRLRLLVHDSSTDDLCRDVATKTLERLSKNGYAALRRYAETRSNYPSLEFSSWLRVVVANLCSDHLRALPGNQRVRDSGARRLVVHKALARSEEMGGHNTVQRKVEIRRVLRWLADPSFPSDQRQALSLWMRGSNASEIAAELDLSCAADATRLLRAGRQRLRRHFEDRS